MESTKGDVILMYSVILATMLTTGATEAQGWHRSVYSCSCSCAGYVVTHRVHHVRGCHGCHGVYIPSCYGCGGCIGATSVGYSLWGAGCYGTTCYGGCYGGSSWGCAGMSSYSQSMPSYGHAEMPAPDYGMPIAAAPAAPVAQVAKAAVATKSARVVLMVPSDAKVWVDNVLCPLQGENRAFNTPVLAPGNQYAYEVTVETPDGGKANRRILMTAGQTVDVDFRATLTARK